MHIYNNPSGEAYFRLIDYGMECCETFSLMDNRPPEGKEFDIPPAFPLRIVEELKPYLVREKWVESRFDHIGHSYYSYDHPVYVWKCCREAAVILKKYTDNLLGWIGKGMPEDLCFQDAEGKDWLWTVTHEEYRELRVTREEAEKLAENLRGTMLIDIKSPPPAEELFELAKYHGSDRLDFTGTGIAPLLPRLHEIPGLRSIDLFDAHITELPDSLFELPHLEKVKVWTGNLYGVPAAIGQARHLRELTIYNGSHPEPHNEPQWQAPSKEDLKLTSLPPEIGLLQNLEVLDITYSGLVELPDELANLQNLKYLILNHHQIETTPTVLKKLRNVKNISFKPNGW